MADPIIEQAAPVIDENAPETSSLSDSRELFDLPLEDTHTREAAPPQETTKETSSPKTEAEPAKETSVEAVKPVETDLSKKPLFETQKEEEKPFKSKEAEEIRSEPPPKGVHAKNWDAAKSKWAGIVEAKDHQINRLQKEATQSSIALQKENEQLAKRVSDLSGYESVIDLQASEKFQNEYENPLKKAQDGLVEFIKNAGATPEGLEEFKKGINDEKYLFQAIAALEKDAPAVASRMRFEVARILDLKQRKEMALEDVKKNHTKFVEERRSEGTKKQAQFEDGLKTSITSHTQALNSEKYPSYPFLVKMRTPEGASPEVAKQVEDHNKAVESNLVDLEKAARDDSPQQRVRLAVGYMTAVVQLGIIQDLAQRLKNAEEFVQRVKKAGTVPDKASGGSLPTTKPEFSGSLSELADQTFQR